jgi:hypothetical protein
MFLRRTLLNVFDLLVGWLVSWLVSYGMMCSYKHRPNVVYTYRNVDKSLEHCSCTIKV